MKALRAALFYAELGWGVFPVFEAIDGKCSCGVADCQNVGKHPRIGGGFKSATTDPRQIEDWWNKWPDANIGIATGPDSGLVVVDIDPRNGGNESFAELQNGAALSKTPTVETGGGGLHYCFAWSPGVNFRSRSGFLPGIDIKALGGYVVAPPSVHQSGKRYRWRDGLRPGDVKPAPLPSWLRRLLQRDSLTGGVRDPQRISEGDRNVKLTSIAGSLRRAGLSAEQIRTSLQGVNQGQCDPPLAESEIENIVRSAQNWEPGVSQSYFSTPEGIFWNRIVRESVVATRLTNFDCRIVADILEDDGVDQKHSCELEVNLLGRTKRVVVSAADFNATTWPLQTLGSTAVLAAGMGIRDHVRAAIQEVSAPNIEERRIYAHSGWRKYRGGYAYLHADGAITAEGLITDVRVQLPPSLASLKLPAPADPDNLKTAVRASLKFLDIAPRSVTYPIYAGIYRAALGTCDFSEHSSGETGAGKTEIAALAQQHYGAAFNARNLPGSWTSTANSLEGLAFTAKDALLVVDDFNPIGTRGDLARYHKDADRLLRAQGNSSGRQRMKADGSLRSAKSPRGLILSTGEEIPRGRSLRARVLVIEVSPDALDWKRVTECQKDAGRGLYSQTMSGYLQWLAPRYSKIKTKLPELVSKIRAQAATSEQHKRTADIVGNLWIGLKLFLQFAVESGAISKEESRKLKVEAWDALGRVAQKQNRHQAAEDPVRRFLELVGAAIATGRAQLGDVETGKSRDGKTECIGWFNDDFTFFDPELSFATAQKLASEQGEFIPLSQKTLWKRMGERGISVQSEAGRNLVRKVIAGRRRSVLALRMMF